MTSRILVTGGLGYLGGSIAQALEAAGEFELLLGTRRPPADRPAWLKRAMPVWLDLARPQDLDALCRNVHCVIHLAALNEIQSAADPSSALIVNGQGSLRVLDAACRQGVERFLYFSTAHVYGAPLAGRIDEGTLPRPSHPYAITHRVAEDFVLAAHQRGAISAAVLRLSNACGPPAHAQIDRWTLVANDFCRQAVTRGRIELMTSGQQARDFIPLGDVARAVLHLMAAPRAMLGDGLFNLGGENPLRIRALAERVAERCARLLGRRPVIAVPGEPGEVAAPMLDYRIDKLKSTGFALSGSLDLELDATLSFCQRAFGGRQVA
jgi:UDP-glucose 4-epimerase